MSQISTSQIAPRDSVPTELCEICYTNEIQTGSGPITDDITIELGCGHRFCKDCCKECLGGHIRNNALNKIVCFAHGCGENITMQKLEKIFTGEDRELLDKLDYFKNKKALEGNPLVRFCPQPDCDGHMIGRNMNERKMTCPKCSHSICFRCREDWHGYCTSCEDAMEAKFEGWGTG